MLAVELFEQGGELLANEMAPRVHNSGHWTIEGAETSQFEPASARGPGRPLGLDDHERVRGDGQLHRRHARPPHVVATVEGAHLHDYGKSPRPGRKVGHITIVADSEDDAAKQRVRDLAAAVPPTVRLSAYAIGARVAQLRDLVGAEAPLAEHLVGVLTGLGDAAGDLRLRARETWRRRGLEDAVVLDDGLAP